MSFYSFRANSHQYFRISYMCGNGRTCCLETSPACAFGAQEARKPCVSPAPHFRTSRAVRARASAPWAQGAGGLQDTPPPKELTSFYRFHTSRDQYVRNQYTFRSAAHGPGDSAALRDTPGQLCGNWLTCASHDAQMLGSPLLSVRGPLYPCGTGQDARRRCPETLPANASAPRLRSCLGARRS